MEEKIREAINLLNSNGYLVRKFPKKLCENAEQCSETGKGDCYDCSCFVCMLGNDD